MRTAGVFRFKNAGREIGSGAVIGMSYVVLPLRENELIVPSDLI